jgi:hypothetical protein
VGLFRVKYEKAEKIFHTLMTVAESGLCHAPDGHIKSVGQIVFFLVCLRISPVLSCFCEKNVAFS